MSENTTRNLPDARSFEERVLAEFAAQRERQINLEENFARLEEKVDRRLMETRPIWEAVLAEVKQMNTKLGHVVNDLYDIRADLTVLTRPVDQIEKA